MVIVRLIGGLGNQLFQYAAGRRAAYVHNVPLKLDISGFESYKLRTLRLHHFGIVADIASPDEIARLKSRRGFNGSVFHLCDRLKPYYKRSVVRERSLDFDPNILKVSPDVYLEGYWGSEKYFKDVEAVIRRELTVRAEPSTPNVAMATAIEQVCAVSVHVRRGDFVSDATTNQFHGLCSLEYYDKAADRVAEMVGEPHFFVFSDDPRWAQENMRFKWPTTFVAHNSAEQDYEDLRLISLCRHHIIANSTFGWWGAWLSSNPGKAIIAPRKWLSDPRYDMKDLFPEGWIRT